MVQKEKLVQNIFFASSMDEPLFTQSSSFHQSNTFRSKPKEKNSGCSWVTHDKFDFIAIGKSLNCFMPFISLYDSFF